IWSSIAAKPEFFLTLEVCSASWLGNAIDALIDAERTADVTGDAFIHGDIRSDNIGIVDSQVKFVDWSHAACGSRTYNLAQLLPPLHLEGGPAPYEVMPNGGSYAAAECARLIRRLGTSQSMPGWLKDVFRRLIAIDLEWASKCIGLPTPDGVRANS